MLPLIAAATFMAALSAASPARACQCPSGPGGGVSWPADGATNVATDTPIVVQLIDYNGDPGKIRIDLTDEAGTEIALNETERVPPSWKGCGAAEAVFLRPARKLEEGVKHTVWISPGSTRLPGATFTVGAHSFEPESAIPAVVTYAAHYPTRECLETDCPAFANIQIELDAPPDRLAWLFMKSSADKHGRQHWPLRPGASDRMFSLTLMQGEADRCVDVRILGVEGRALFEERVCQPSACALCTTIAGSTCGDPSSCSRMVSCDEPKVTSPDAGATRVDAGSDQTDNADGGISHDAGPRARGHRRRAGGCSALPGRPRDAGLAGLALPLLAAILNVRGRSRRRVNVWE